MSSLLWVVVVVVLVLAVVGSPSVGVAPAAYGWWPSGFGLLLVVVLLVLLLR